MAHGVFKAALLLFLSVPHLCQEPSRQQGASEPQSSSKHERRESHVHGSSMPIESHSTEKQPDRFPYMCSILHRGSRRRVCSGFLIRPEWVVTAASCVDPMIRDIGLNPVLYCDADGKDGVKREKFFSGTGVIHPSWSGDYRKGFDIALLKLNRKTSLVLPELNKHMVRLSPVRPLIALGKANGTSMDRLDSPVDSMHLSYITSGACRRYVPFTVTDHMLCAITDNNDTLKGDVGGPLLIPDREDRIVEGFAELDFVLGIASGHTETTYNSTAIYTSIAHFWNWVEHVVDGKSISSKELHKPTPLLEPQPRGHLYSDLSGKDLETVLKTAIAKIEGDNAPGLRKILTGGLSLDSVSGSHRYTLLHWAAYHDSPDCIEVLIEFGANVDAKDMYMRTPLSIAALRDSLSAAKVLLTHLANIEATDKYQYTPLFNACAYQKWNVAELLINKGANVHAKTTWGSTLLHFDSKYGATNVVKLLITKGAEVDARNNDSETPLWWASYFAHSSNVQTVKALLDAGASKTAKANDGRTPYDVVCKSSGFCTDAYKKQLRDLLDPTIHLFEE